MTSSLKTVGPRTARLITKLYDRNQLVFDLNTAAELMETDRVRARSVLHAATRRGLVTRVQRGLYNLVPFELGSATTHLQNRYELAAALMGSRPYFLSHASALDLHHLATQPSFAVYVSTPYHLANRNLAGSELHFVTIPADRMFGVISHDLGERRTVRVSDIERTLIDGLTMPEHCAGIIEVAKAFSMARSRLALDKLLTYAHELRRGSVIRRLGFLLETLGLAPLATLEALRVQLPPGAVALDPALPVKGARWSRRWGLRVNVTAEEVRRAVSH
ncbi:MAG: type IV toxin-antitoxin system AbiEi family antitoxin domain-containing protein [Steroidobacteraceae bacterium]